MREDGRRKRPSRFPIVSFSRRRIAMTQPFFITGLPQSRTSWLANLFCTGNVFCFHDLLGVVKGLREFVHAMGTTAPRTGDSDSGLLACYAQVNQAFPEAPWILVERDFDDAWDSLCQFVNDGPWRDKLACTHEVRERMQSDWERTRLEMVRNPRVMSVPFESLDSVEMIETMWKHCVPGMRFDRRRALLLQTLRVQPMQSKVSARPRMSLVRELSPTH